jgi:NAD(P)-dependent dehydrogenase (short-subunit alcohol dehydrogenase family)
VSDVCVIVGVGPALGSAVARRFAEGYAIGLIARSAEPSGALAREIESRGGRALSVQADVARPADLEAAFARIRAELGPPGILIFNAAMRPFGRLMETSFADFEQTWRINAGGFFLSSQQVVPGMLAAGSGVILVTGATSGVKPFPTSAAFGPAEFALRGLAQVMARDLGPQGIHVAYINVDGPIDNERTRRRRSELTDEDTLKPSAIADTYWHLAHQDRSAWSQEIDVRPFKEKF